MGVGIEDEVLRFYSMHEGSMHLNIKGDMSPLNAFKRLIQSTPGCEALAAACLKHPEDFIEVETVHESAGGTSELLLRFYPSKRYLRLAGAFLAGK